MRQRPATIVATFIPETILRVWERGPLPIVPLPPSSVSQLCIDDVSIEPLPPSSMSQPSVDDIRLSVVPPPPHPSVIVRREAAPCCHVATSTDKHPFRRVATLTDERLRRVTTPTGECLLRRAATLPDERLLRCVATLIEYLCQVTILMDESGLHPAQAPESATPPAPMSNPFINNAQQHLATMQLHPSMHVVVC